MDRDRLCLWAFSGGGPFLADPLRAWQAYVRCLVACYTVMDLRPLAANAPLDLLNHPIGYHAFDARNDDARTRQMISHILAFVRDNLEA